MVDQVLKDCAMQFTSKIPGESQIISPHKSELAYLNCIQQTVQTDACPLDYTISNQPDSMTLDCSI
jgi:hypothetical protein